MDARETLLSYLDERQLALDPLYQREALRVLVQALMESEVSQMLDAALYERNDTRRAYRNGYRASLWQTALGEIALQIPKLRKGSYYPGFLAAETALQCLIQEAYVSGLDIEALRAALDLLPLRSLSAQNLADVLERLDDAVYNAQTQPLNIPYPFLLVDVLDVPGRPWRQILLALGIRESGQAELLAHEIVSTADDRGWIHLLRRLNERGLETVEAVISRDYPGLRTAVESVYVDAVWQHQERVLLRADPDAPLVDAVSRLVLNAGSEDEQGPLMQLSVNLAEVNTLWPLFAVA